MKQKLQLFGNVILFAGIALIVAGYFIFVPQESRDDVFWLNVTVTCFAFSITTTTELGLWGFGGAFDKQIGGLGIRLAFIPLYAILAVVTIVIGYVAHVEFQYQVFFHLAAAFVLLIGWYSSSISSGTAQTIQAQQDSERLGKNQIQTIINQYDLFMAGNSSAFGAEKQKLETIKETVRYLSPTNNPTAAQLDAEIASLIEQAYTITKTTGSDGQVEVYSLLNRCEELLKLRKNTYSN